MKAFDAALEIQALRSILKKPEDLGAYLGRLNHEYFNSPEASEILNRVVIYINSGKDIPSAELLKNDMALSEAARVALTNEIQTISSKSEMDTVVEILSKYRKARIIQTVIFDALETMKQDNPDVDSVISTMAVGLEQCNVGSSKSEMLHMTPENCEEILADTFEELESEDSDYIPTGFTEFDEKSGGFRKKNVITIASVPGGGKSAMALQMAANQFLAGHKVCIASFEMDEIEVKFRLLSSISEIDHSTISLKRLTKKHKAIIEQKFRDFLKKGKRLTIWTPSRDLNITDIKMEIKHFGFDVIYVDYIGLLKSDDKKQMWEMLGEHARAAKKAANELDAAMVLLAQYDDQESKIKYSKAIVANSNFVWAWDNSEKERELGIIEVKQLKARNAEVYPFYLQRSMNIMSFKNHKGPIPTEVPEDGPAPTLATEVKKPSMPKVVTTDVTLDSNPTIEMQETAETTQDSKKEVISKMPKMPIFV